MKKIITLTLFYLVFFTSVSGQIAKNNWLFGGNINFSSIKSSSDLGSNTEIIFQASGNAGYFFIDKLAAGIRPALYFATYKRSSTTKSNNSSIGPFLRYYFLRTDQRVNFFIDANYNYGIAKVSNQDAIHFNSFAFLTGPVIFLNNSVALEFNFGYKISKSDGAVNSKLNLFQTGIGFQFHLEKE